MARLNLGSYLYPIKGWWNVDIEKWDGVDEVVDLNKLPWPWEDGAFEEVRAVDIVEHLGKLTKVEIVGELARVTKVGGWVEIRVPCGSHPIALQSLQHAHVFYFDSFEKSYAQPWFECERIECSFLGNRFRVVFRSPLRFLVRMLGRLGLVYCLTFHLRKV